MSGASATSESAVQSAILRWSGTVPDLLRLWRNNTGVGLTPDARQVIRYGLVGSADLTGILADGRRLEIECKRPRGGEWATAQQAFAAMIERFKGIYILARSVDDVTERLTSEGYDCAAAPPGRIPRPRPPTAVRTERGGNVPS